ncbi:polyprenyl synthetase family protein [Salinibacterium sp. ZJ77]|uniref:polyprenyl synthetase family protein n=1 Tax=Salinibacterium sp. ZJ77 TaxID=2708337 RepID=UPI00141F848C|nr:polyprenyl synthetase family protein [Salinibacterium sp. ZJ77]
MTVTAPQRTEDLELINRALHEFLTEQLARTLDHDERFRELWHRIIELAQGGKRVRPRAVLSAHHHLGGTRHDDALATAVAFELLHTALVIHDDIIDGDLERRGAPNITARFAEDAAQQGVSAARSRLWGETMSLLGGDLLLTSAVRIAGELDAPRRVRARVAALIDESIYEAASGEQADVAFGIGLDTPDPSAIRTMMERKTASYSFDAPLRAGAVLAGADDLVVRRLGTIGRSLGLLFQMRDDLLGVFGTPEETGKSASGDLREGKVTLLVSHAAGTPEWAEVASHWGSADLDEAGVELLRDALIRSGARDRLECEIADQAAHTFDLIEIAELPIAFGDELRYATQNGIERSR